MSNINLNVDVGQTKTLTFNTKDKYNSEDIVFNIAATDTLADWVKAATKPSYTWSEINNKPTFATVATSGSYNDLTNKPSLNYLPLTGGTLSDNLVLSNDTTTSPKIVFQRNTTDDYYDFYIKALSNAAVQIGYNTMGTGVDKQMALFDYNGGITANKFVKTGGTSSQFLKADGSIDSSSYATLDNTGKVPTSQLPSYVDDVVEYTNKASFPSTGEKGKIYVDVTANDIYRWTGSTYIKISGIIGAQGEKGAQGATGLQGATGSRGVQGYQGLQGSKGETGAQGYRGYQGYQGIQGIKGTDGTNGTNGVQGYQGYTGAQGATGVQGYQGLQGKAGTNGTNGSRGVQGYQGYDGIKGATGVQGYQGIRGATGATGAQGEQGIQGFQGFQGKSGVDGLQGAIGLQGKNGTNGSNGAQGYQGYQGLQGKQGLQGATGIQGKNGTNGTNGTNGSQGYQGIRGATGPQGPQGLQGIPGLTGANGVQGYQGLQGPAGTGGASMEENTGICISTTGSIGASPFGANANTILLDSDTNGGTYTCVLGYAARTGMDFSVSRNIVIDLRRLTSSSSPFIYIFPDNAYDLTNSLKFLPGVRYNIYLVNLNAGAFKFPISYLNYSHNGVTNNMLGVLGNLITSSSGLPYMQYGDSAKIEFCINDQTFTSTDAVRVDITFDHNGEIGNRGTSAGTIDTNPDNIPQFSSTKKGTNVAALSATSLEVIQSFINYCQENTKTFTGMECITTDKNTGTKMVSNADLMGLIIQVLANNGLIKM